jgi:[acyl-carrier-protein] S-malonyltransferase
MKIAFVFPGQGSQSVGMLASFADSAPAQDVIRRADAALGMPLSRLIADGPAEDLSLTVNTQPAMLAASVAMYAA